MVRGHDNKPFSKELYDLYDERGKSAVKEWVNSTHSFTANDSDDKYGVDLLITYKVTNEIRGLEVEIKNEMSKKGFNWPTLDIPKRKVKFIENMKVIYCVLSPNLERMYLVDGKYLKREFIRKKDTSYSKDEPFFKIPIHYCILVTRRLNFENKIQDYFS